jgi:hypothetical protein
MDVIPQVEGSRPSQGQVFRWGGWLRLGGGRRVALRHGFSADAELDNPPQRFGRQLGKGASSAAACQVAERSQAKLGKTSGLASS